MQEQKENAPCIAYPHGQKRHRNSSPTPLQLRQDFRMVFEDGDRVFHVAGH